MREGRQISFEDLSLTSHKASQWRTLCIFKSPQIVLDCLRSRSKCARLVGCGPKSTSIRKLLKSDADAMSIESEDNEENIVKMLKNLVVRVSSHIRLSEGKCKARKRRRLALQGREIVRQIHRTEVVSDDESESFSTSSRENNS